MKKSGLSRILNYNINTPIAFVAIVLFFIIFTPNHLFIDLRNLASMGKLIPDLGIVALGVGMLMICGEFDLSITSLIPLCSYVFVTLLMKGINPALALIIILPVGAALGFINGVIVVKTGLPSFIITLSTMLFWRGVVYGLSRMSPIALTKYINPYPSFEKILTGTIGRFPVQVIWFVGIAIILGLLLHFNKFGNWIFATGSSKETARAMGINTNMVKTTCYIIIGVLCAVVCTLQAVRLGSFNATQGIGFELKTIAAAVVGGTSLRGGVGNMLNIFLGILIIKIIENGLILMRVPVFGVEAFIGLAIILFVIINNFIQRRMT
ncbi:Ribose import permease protein RbsC [subsurface metagenome]